MQDLDNGTLYINNQDYSNVLIPLNLDNTSAVFHCKTRESSSIECEPTKLKKIRKGEEVCVYVKIKRGELDPIKAFFNATCGGPQSPKNR